MGAYFGVPSPPPPIRVNEARALIHSNGRAVGEDGQTGEVVQSSQAAAGNQNLSNISASVASNMLASSPVPAHRRHLDRLGIQSSKVMTELMNSLQQLELNGFSGLQAQAAVAAGEGELMEEPVQRVQSRRNLRAEIYRRLRRENLQDISESL
eukprot:Gb_12057 [translate_table: standard]